MVKFAEAQARMFRNKFVCRSCKATVKAPNQFVIDGKVKCRRCHSRALRPKRKK